MVLILILFVIRPITSFGQIPENSKEAEDILARSVAALGGEKYQNVTSAIGRGRFSLIRDGAVISFQSFIDVIVFPDKERTEFKSAGIKTVQTNSGETGWIFDGDAETLKDQTPMQIESFRRGMRVSIDYLLRGYWRGQAELEYVGKRPATLGKRNDVVRLTYDDGLVVEFEFSTDDALPAKAIHRRTNADGEEITEEDRYAQFVEVGGIRSPFIIDRFTSGKHSSRINFQSIEYNKRIPDSIFLKPANPKELKRDLKL